MGSGCGSVGRAVASDTSGPQFESSHRYIFKEHLFTAFKKTKIKEERPGMAHLKILYRSRLIVTYLILGLTDVYTIQNP